MITLATMAKRYGVTGANLRQRVATGKLAATRCACGREWMVTEAEAARYEREHLGRYRRGGAAG